MPPEELDDELELLDEDDELLDDELELLELLDEPLMPQLLLDFTQTPAYWPGLLLLHQCSWPVVQL